MDTETLGNLLRKVVKGFWFQYYAQELPARIARDPHSVEEEIHRLFSRFTHLVSRAERAYSGLLPHEQSLVQWLSATRRATKKLPTCTDFSVADPFPGVIREGTPDEELFTLRGVFIDHAQQKLGLGPVCSNTRVIQLNKHLV